MITDGTDVCAGAWQTVLPAVPLSNGHAICRNVQRWGRSVSTTHGSVCAPGGGVAARGSQVSAPRSGCDAPGWGLRADHPLGHERRGELCG